MWRMSCVTCHMSRVTCHKSHVICHISHLTCHMSRIMYHMSYYCYFWFDKVVMLVGGGFVISRAYRVNFLFQYALHFQISHDSSLLTLLLVISLSPLDPSSFGGGRVTRAIPLDPGFFRACQVSSLSP